MLPGPPRNRAAGPASATSCNAAAMHRTVSTCPNSGCTYNSVASLMCILPAMRGRTAPPLSRRSCGATYRASHPRCLRWACTAADQRFVVVYEAVPVKPAWPPMRLSAAPVRSVSTSRSPSQRTTCRDAMPSWSTREAAVARFEIVQQGLCHGHRKRRPQVAGAIACCVIRIRVVGVPWMQSRQIILANCRDYHVLPTGAGVRCAATCAIAATSTVGSTGLAR